MRSTTQTSDQQLFEQYVRYRMGLMPNPQVDAIDVATLAAQPVVFLTPVGTGNLRGQDEFPQVLEQLGGNRYQPTNKQSFFSFTNTYGGHWSLVKHRFNLREGLWEEPEKIECRGDGACGVHAMVNAVLNNKRLKNNPKIIKAAEDAQLDLTKKNSRDLTQAINFVINIIGNGGNDEQKKVVKKLEDLRDTNGAREHWVDTGDIEIFAGALEVLHCNRHKILNEEGRNRKIAERAETIAANIRGDNNSVRANYRAQEMTQIFDFTRGDEDQAQRIANYAKSLGTVMPKQDLSGEDEDFQRAIAESLKTQSLEGFSQEDINKATALSLLEVNGFIENEENDADLRLGIALSLAELSKNKEDFELQKVIQESIRYAQEEQKLRNRIAKKTDVGDIFVEIKTQRDKSKKVKFGDEQKIPNSRRVSPAKPPIFEERDDKKLPTRHKPLATQKKRPEQDAGIELPVRKPKSAIKVAVTAEQKREAIEKISEWMNSDQPPSFVSKAAQKDPIIIKVQSALKEQAKNPDPDGAYIGIGAETVVAEIDGKYVLKIKDVFAPHKARFYTDKGNPDLDLAKSLKGQFITAVVINGKTSTIEELMKADNAEEIIAKIFHDGKHDIEFTVQDLGGNKRQVGCQRRENQCFVTDKCLAVKAKLGDKKGDICDPINYGLEPFGGAKLFQQEISMVAQ